MGLVPWEDILSPRIGLAQLDAYEVIGELAASGFGERARRAVAAVEARDDTTKERRDG
jgi:hypothetical protein